MQKGNLERLKELVPGGDLASFECQFGSLLHLAAFFGSAEMIERLLEAGVPANLQLKTDGSTALHLAARFGRLAVVEALLRHDQVDDTIVDSHGKTPYEVAKNRTISFAIECKCHRFAV